MTGIYEIILTAPDGRRQKSLAWLPNEAVRQDFHNRAARNGLSIEEKRIA